MPTPNEEQKTPNVIIEMIKLAAVMKGGMKPEIAEAIGNSIDAVISKLDAVCNSTIVANETAAVRSLLDSARLAAEVGKTELAAVLIEQAGDMVMDDEEDDGEEGPEEIIGLPEPEPAKA